MNNWYVAMSRGEDAPVLDVIRAPINGRREVTQNCARNADSGVEQPAAAPPIEPAADQWIECVDYAQLKALGDATIHVRWTLIGDRTIRRASDLAQVAPQEWGTGILAYRVAQ